MARVRAKTNVYLGEYGYRTAGEEFEYKGPANHHLETVEKSTADGEVKQVRGKGK